MGDWDALEADITYSNGYKETKIRFFIDGVKYGIRIPDKVLAQLAWREHETTPVIKVEP